jgi:hypothetical protein
MNRRRIIVALIPLLIAARAPAGANSLGTPTSTPGTSPPFIGSVRWIDPTLRAELIHRNWHPGCPVPIRDLRLVTVSYWTFDGRVKQGPLIINETAAADVLSLFRKLFDARFPIQKIALAAKYRPPRPSDWYSTVNVTASFNCRPVTGTTDVFSQHSYGWAIDINPMQNPYIGPDGDVLRAADLPYVDRSQYLPGMIHNGDVVVRAFEAIGWGWGGDWHSLKDYMHFSATGR